MVMADEDFDLETLAAYLHLDPAQISRLAERGKLPGRKVAGQWRFASAEVHHWLEDRIGISSDEELVQMEDVLRLGSDHPDHEPDVSIVEMLPVEAIAVPLAARTRGSVITSMAEVAAQTGWLWDVAKLADAVRAREDLLPTAQDNGVALLHPRRPLSNILEQPFLAMGRTETGIPFGGARGTLTDIFFLICSVDDRGHLRVLARLSRLLADPVFLTALREAGSAAEAHEVIVRHEGQLS
jgi:PTS system nitrogen regulatory IIA component